VPPAAHVGRCERNVVPLSPPSGARGQESWPGVLQGHLLGTEAGWLVTKAECGGTRGGCLLDGSSLRMFHCLPGSALPPAHPRFTGPSCRCLSGGKHSPFGSRPLLCGPLLIWGEGPARHQCRKLGSGRFSKRPAPGVDGLERTWQPGLQLGGRSGPWDQWEGRAPSQDTRGQGHGAAGSEDLTLRVHQDLSLSLWLQLGARCARPCGPNQCGC